MAWTPLKPQTTTVTIVKPRAAVTESKYSDYQNEALAAYHIAQSAYARAPQDPIVRRTAAEAERRARRALMVDVSEITRAMIEGGET